jgi:transcriptional regulator with XRE-family HTH domain
MQGKPTRRQTRRGPAPADAPADIHVAMRVRERRIELGMSQPTLAAALGITFQNLYKYEKAKSRISAGRLYDLSKALGVPVGYFFEGIEGGLRSTGKNAARTR